MRYTRAGWSPGNHFNMQSDLQIFGRVTESCSYSKWNTNSNIIDSLIRSPDHEAQGQQYYIVNKDDFKPTTDTRTAVTDKVGHRIMHYIMVQDAPENQGGRNNLTQKCLCPKRNCS